MIGAAWTFYAVPAWRSDCGAPWDDLSRELPERPRFLLTNEQLLQPGERVMWPLGSNPFRPEPADEPGRASLHNRFVERLAAAIAWIDQPQHVDDNLLKEARRDLDARKAGQ